MWLGAGVPTQLRAQNVGFSVGERVGRIRAGGHVGQPMGHAKIAPGPNPKIGSSIGFVHDMPHIKSEAHFHLTLPDTGIVWECESKGLKLG